MQTQIPSPPRSLRTELSSDKTLSEELTANDSPTPDTTSKESSMSQPNTCKILPGSVAKMSRCSELAIDKTNELMNEAIPRMVKDAVNKDRKIFADVVPELVAKEFATHAPKILEELFKCHMKNKAQATDPEMGKRPEIGEDVAFKIKTQLLRELCDNTFSGNKTEDAMEHLRKVLEIASLFNTPGISRDDMMLRIFPLTLVGAAKRWLGRTSFDILKTWDELKQVFIRRFCPPSVTFMQVDTFYKGLGFHARQILDSRGLILGLTVVEALESIQEMADHSHKWHNEESDRKTSNNNYDSLKAIVDKLKNLNRDMNDLRKNVHKIHQRSNKKFHHEEVKSMRAWETKQDNQRFTKPLSNLKETSKQYLEESRKRQNILDTWIQNFMENTNKNLQRHELTIKKLEKKVFHLAYVLTDRKVKHNTSVMDGIPNASTSIQHECAMKEEPHHKTPINKMETFAEKVKRRIMETQANEEKLLLKLESEPVNTILVKDI
ncbi:hypothetical protein Tco_0512596 [Tanacetum coccineum]